MVSVSTNSCKNTQKDKYVGYKTLLDDLLQFEFNGLLELLLNRLVENENSIFETFISKQASSHMTCHNCYDRYHLQCKLGKLETVHETA